MNEEVVKPLALELKKEPQKLKEKGKNFPSVTNTTKPDRPAKNPTIDTDGLFAKPRVGFNNDKDNYRSAISSIRVLVMGLSEQCDNPKILPEGIKKLLKHFAGYEDMQEKEFLKNMQKKDLLALVSEWSLIKVAIEKKQRDGFGGALFKAIMDSNIGDLEKMKNDMIKTSSSNRPKGKK